MTDWQGHKQATTAVLLDLVTTAHTGRTRFSRSERALFTACEFWAASRNGSLADLLADDSCSQLRAAEDSFNFIGLKKIASALMQARSELSETFSATDVAKQLEVSLSEIDEPVDLVLARFATEGVSAIAQGIFTT
jgi:sigma54-dependent transcription regulator